jgi:protein-disulfide isomerase
MKRLLLAGLLAAACRPADGGSRSTPSSTSAASPTTAGAAAQVRPAQTDAQRIDSLLQLADAERIQGAASAPVWLVEISDFQCPYCKQFHDEVYPAIKREYIDRGIVRMAYVHLPLSIHPNAPAAAEASMCVAVQKKFWPMHDRIFATQQTWAQLPNPVAFFDSLAVSLGADQAAYRECMSSQVMRRLLSGDRARAGAAGARSTPIFFVGDEPIQGLAPLDAYRQAIERARAKSATRPGP